MKLADLSNAQLLDRVKSLCDQGRATLARLLADLIEVEKRRLHLEAACPSMFQFCVTRLGMSEDEACRRIHVARLAQRFPDLLVRIERGDLTLSTIALLHDALTETAYEELVDSAAGKTKAEVQAILAKRCPVPDVATSITAIPTQAPIPTLGVASVPAPTVTVGRQIAPLSETRHKVQFTASDELRKKLERAQDLMRHANAEGDLVIVVERAVDLLIEKLEKQRFGKTSRPRPSRHQHALARDEEESDTAGSDRACISRATRRAVFERDGARCTFTSAGGQPAGTTSSARSTTAAIRASIGIHASADTHPKAATSQRTALVNMGFGRAEARRALDRVSARHSAEDLTTIPVQTILREALAVLM